MVTDAGAPRRFQYLADPVFITSLFMYAFNRFWLKPHHIGGWFTHGYLNDVLCLPLFVPITLYIGHLLGVRKGARFPRSWEIGQSWLAFVIVFQLVTPRFPRLFVTAGDPWDVLAYFAGGVVAAIIWSRLEVPHLLLRSDR